MSNAKQEKLTYLFAGWFIERNAMGVQPHEISRATIKVWAEQNHYRIDNADIDYVFANWQENIVFID